MDELLVKISILFKKYGTRSITMEDIAKELCISKKTLYQHFENKYDIVLKIGNFELENERIELEKQIENQKNEIDQLLIISKFRLNGQN